MSKDVALMLDILGQASHRFRDEAAKVTGVLLADLLPGVVSFLATDLKCEVRTCSEEELDAASVFVDGRKSWYYVDDPTAVDPENKHRLLPDRVSDAGEVRTVLSGRMRVDSVGETPDVVRGSLDSLVEEIRMRVDYECAPRLLVFTVPTAVVTILPRQWELQLYCRFAVLVDKVKGRAASPVD